MEIKKPSAPDAAIPAEILASHASASALREAVQSGTATTAAGAAQPLTARQTEILKSRGIDTELALKMGWRSSGQRGFGEAIEIPYLHEGREVNCKTRTLEGEKRFYQREGAEKCLYNLDAIKAIGDHPLVITEGEMDCMIALQCGYIAVSVPDGAPKDAIGEKHTVKYEYLTGIPTGINKIILAVDGDNAGANLLHDLSIRLGKHRCMWVKYPKGCKDLNDTFKLWGARGVNETIARAQYIEIEGLYALDELPPLSENPALDVGIPELQNHFKLRAGDFSVVTGIPSHGKSTFVNHIAFNMAKIHGWHVTFASFEQPPQTEHRRALRTLHCAKWETLMTDAEKEKSDAWICRNISFIVPNDERKEWADMDWLMDLMAAAVVRKNAKLLVIDPWNEMDHIYDQKEKSSTQYIGESIKALKRFAKRFQVHVMVVAHPAKMKRDKEGAYPVPTAYDISDSAHWYNKPEQVVVIHRMEEKLSLIRIAKSRYHRILGTPADVELQYNSFNGKYEGIAVSAVDFCERD